MSATADLLDFARASHILPHGVRSDAVRLLADTLAVGAAGATAPGADGVLAASTRWGAANESRLLGSPERLPAPSAAFVNGFRIHCLEWDAVHEGAVVHALSVVTAALGASIDRMGGCDPDAALTALAVGVDIAAGLGLAATSPLRFFRPATAGCIGAALAVARLEGVEAMEDVLGLAYSSCSGTMQAHVEGSIALPLQIANAARAGVAAVDLVRAGLSGPHDALEGPFGYFRLFEQGNLATYTADLGKVWCISEVSTKPYPCGRASHAVVDFIDTIMWPDDRLPRSRRIEQSDGISWDSFRKLAVFVPPLVKRLIDRPMRQDMTPAYARLCLPLLSAMMLVDGIIDPRRFTPDAFADPLLVSLAQRIEIKLDENKDENALAPQYVSVWPGASGVIAVSLEAVAGSPAAPLSPERVAAKLALARELAPSADHRIFDDPLGYWTAP